MKALEFLQTAARLFPAHISDPSSPSTTGALVFKISNRRWMSIFLGKPRQLDLFTAQGGPYLLVENLSRVKTEEDVRRIVSSRLDPECALALAESIE